MLTYFQHTHPRGGIFQGGRTFLFTLVLLVAVGSVTSAVDVKVDAAPVQRETTSAPQPAWLGVHIVPVSDATAKQANLSRPAGALLPGLHADGPGARAGLQVGDIVLKVNDTWILDFPQLVPAIMTRTAGEQVNVLYARDGQALQTSVVLGARPSDADLAVRLRGPANRGEAWAQCELGWSYQYGLGVPRNDATALDWHSKAARQGAANSQLALGEMYLNGNGVAKNESVARAWLRKAAEQGHAEAQWLLGVTYEQIGGTKNYGRALEWYQKATERGLAQAQCNLGLRYYRGVGVQKSYKTAEQWFRRAAEQGLPEAQYNLGLMYQNGDGVRRDRSKAIAWYKRAANQGLVPAQEALKGRSAPAQCPRRQSGCR